MSLPRISEYILIYASILVVITPSNVLLPGWAIHCLPGYVHDIDLPEVCVIAPGGQPTPEQPTPGPLSVEIIPSGTEGVAPATFEFGTTIIGGQEPYSISWDFGDGTTASGQANTQHTFEADGTYYVWVAVTDANNVEASNIVQVFVTPQQPTPTPQQPTPTPQQPTPTPQQPTPEQSDVQDPNAGDSNFQPGFDFPEVTTTEPVVDMFPLIVLAAIVVIGGIALGKYSKNRNRSRRLRISPSAVVDIYTKGGTRE